MRRTDILVGVHGAGLTHVVFLPPHGFLLELRAGENHFKNLAGYAGRGYFDSGYTPQVDVTSLVSQVRSLVGRVREARGNA